MKVVAILQARMSSSRLPGKVLKIINGRPMLALQCERIQRSKMIDKLIIATSDERSDDVIATFSEQLNISFFRGPLDDVLGRYYLTSQSNPSTHIVRLTGDCPLADPQVIDSVISFHLAKQADYTSNCIPPTLPDGLDVEVFTSDALKIAYLRAETQVEREHVTPYFRKHPEQFILANYENETDFSGRRWTVDEPVDFSVIEKVFMHFSPRIDFTWQEVLELQHQQPDIFKINQHLIHN